MNQRERLLDDEILAILRAAPTVPPHLTERIISRIASESADKPRPARARKWWVASIGAAAAIAVLSWMSANVFEPHGEEVRASASMVAATTLLEPVRFAIHAEDANSVTVVGDFNNWNARATPLGRGPGGDWVLNLPLRPGRYTYAFIIDGSRWQADPHAPMTADADFGKPGSVILVGAGL